MVFVNDRVRFDPFKGISGFASDSSRGKYVIGTVVYVNYGHKWFSVEYGCPAMRTSFNFADIGRVVKVIGRKEDVYTKDY